MASTTVALKAPHRRMIVAKHMCHSTATAESEYTVFDKQANAMEHLETLQMVYEINQEMNTSNQPPSTSSTILPTSLSQQSSLTSINHPPLTTCLRVRVKWEETHLNKLKELFYEYINDKIIPTLPDIRQILKSDEYFFKNLCEERDIIIENKKSLEKLYHAVLSRVKSFI